MDSKPQETESRDGTTRTDKSDTARMSAKSQESGAQKNDETGTGKPRGRDSLRGAAKSGGGGGVPAGPKRKKSLFGKLVPFVVIAAVALAAYWLWSSTQKEGFGDGFAGGNGRLEATEIDVASKLAGRIVEIRVDEGDGVKSGEILAVMQTDSLQAKLNEAEAQVLKAKAAEISANAQVAVKESDHNAALATVAQRRSELDQTQRRLERSAVLSKKGVITGQEFDDDETSEMAAKAAVGTAQAQVGVAKAAIEAAKADARGVTAAVRAAEATVASIQADLDDCWLKAPRDGRVQYRIVQPGEVLAAGGKVLNFVDLTDVYMNFYLPSEQYGRVALGAEARVVLDAFPNNPIPASITYKAATAQFTPKTVETESEREKLMFRVKAKIDKKVLAQYPSMINPGLPGVAWVRLDAGQEWPEELRTRPADASVPRASE